MNDNEESKETLNQTTQKKEETNQGDKYVTIKLLFVLACIIFIIYCMVSIFANNSSKTSSKNSSTDYKLEAYIMSQEFIEKELKAPATAEFPSYHKISVVQTDNRYKVKAYVDSENSFGAKIRTNYYITLERNSDESWTKISCEIE